MLTDDGLTMAIMLAFDSYINCVFLYKEKKCGFASNR